jgi:hypothetical protein
MIEPQAGKHAWYGSCDPRNGYGFSRYRHSTFSVGCFECIPKPSDGLKRGPIKVRVSGPVSSPELVYNRAREICLQLDDGTYTGPSRVTVRNTPTTTKD